MEVVNALAALGFSFWQPVVLLLVLLFRRELRDILGKISTLKVAGTELTLSSRREAVNELRELSAEMQAQGSSPESKQVAARIEALLEKKYLGALLNIKRSATDLWPKLAALQSNEEVEAKARRETYGRIQDDLHLLKEGGFFRVEAREWLSDFMGGAIMTLVLSDFSDAFFRLRDEARQF